jgi:hypothetical protein
VTKSRPGPRLARRTAEAALPTSNSFGQAWLHFWFKPIDPVGLHVARLLTGLILLAWLLPLAPDADALFGLGGWFDRQAFREAARLEGGPPEPFTWSVLYLCGSKALLLKAACGFALVVFALFALGVWTRITAALTWVLVASFSGSPFLVSEADKLLLPLSLYLMIGYGLAGLADRDQPMVRRLLGPRGAWLFGRRPGGTESMAANLALRLMQVHLAILMVVGGLHKLQFGEWWAGTALWHALHPAVDLTPAQIGTPAQLRTSLLGLGLATYAVLAWQVGFPAFCWRPRWRVVLLGGAFLAWLGSAIVYHVPIYGPALCVGCLSYLMPGEWHRLFALLGKIPGLARLVPLGPETAGSLLLPEAKFVGATTSQARDVRDVS